MANTASISANIAGRYAQAVFDLVKEEGALDRLSTEVESLRETPLCDAVLGYLAILRGRGVDAHAQLDRAWAIVNADRARINTRGQAVASRAKTGRNQVTAPIFLLVPQVKLPKRLDLARDADRALDGVPGLIVANWVDGRT